MQGKKKLCPLAEATPQFAPLLRLALIRFSSASALNYDVCLFIAAGSRESCEGEEEEEMVSERKRVSSSQRLCLERGERERKWKTRKNMTGRKYEEKV